MKNPPITKLIRYAFLAAVFTLLSQTAFGQNYVLTNLWSITAGTSPIFTTGGFERGLSYNPITTHLLVVSRTGPKVFILDSNTGVSNGVMNTTGVITSGTSISFNLNMIGVADDGVIYACNLTIPTATPTAVTNNFVIYRWADESAAPTIAFQGSVGSPGFRFGDNLEVRGSGTNTTLMAGQNNNTIVGKAMAFFTTTDGTSFNVNVITNSTAINSDFNRGIAFGPGNSYYSKNAGATVVKYSTFNLGTSTSTVQYSFSSGFEVNLGPMQVDTTNKLMAFLRYNATASANQFVSLYTISADPSVPPALQDTKFFSSSLANANGVGSVEFGGGKLFVLNTASSINAYQILTATASTPPTITTAPSSQSAYVGASLTLGLSVIGSAPFYYQWSFQGSPISGATNSSYSLTNITTNMQGNYSVVVTNTAGSTNAVATLTVKTPYQTAKMTNVWNLLPLSRVYLGDADFAQRGLAYNPLTKNLLLASRSPTNLVVVLNSTNGAESHFLSVDSSIITSGGGITYPLNVIGAGDDGVIYGANLVTAGSAASFRLYAWNDDSGNPGSGPFLTMSPQDPGAGSNLRWGDSMAVRGGGVNTQIILGSGNSNVVSVLTTADGFDFSSHAISISENGNPAPYGFAQLGITWGAGNTFWAKGSGFLLRHVEFDINSGTGTVINSYTFTNANTVPSSVTTIGVDATNNLLAGISFENPDNVQLYSIADLAVGPVLLDQELFSVKNANGNLTGVAVFGDNHLFVLDSNNGIRAFSIDPNFVPALGAYHITSVSAPSGSVILTCETVAGHSYQVQSKASLSDAMWTDVGSPVVATGTTTSFTNSVSGATQFYRIKGQ